MNNQSAVEIQALSPAAKNFPSPTYTIRPPMAFLSLAPALSTSVPTQRAKPSTPQTESALVDESAVLEGNAGTTTAGVAKARRSSSGLSDVSASSGVQKFLRLGNGMGDWSEVNNAVE
jgi:hypothetical protein